MNRNPAVTVHTLKYQADAATMADPLTQKMKANIDTLFKKSMTPTTVRPDSDLYKSYTTCLNDVESDPSVDIDDRHDIAYSALLFDIVHDELRKQGLNGRDNKKHLDIINIYLLDTYDEKSYLFKIAFNDEKSRAPK